MRPRSRACAGCSTSRQPTRCGPTPRVRSRASRATTRRACAPTRRRTRRPSTTRRAAARSATVVDDELRVMGLEGLRVVRRERDADGRARQHERAGDRDRRARRRPDPRARDGGRRQSGAGLGLEADAAPRQRAHLAGMADPRADTRLRARRRLGAADARAVRTTSRTWCGSSRCSTPSTARRRPSARCSRCAGRSAGCSAGTTTTRGSARACRRCATGSRRTSARRASGPDFEALPFSPLYLTDDEFAAEIANRTVHAVMHIGWVPDGGDRHHAQMAVLVKPNGRLGRLYMAAIRPFRHVLVYPRMLSEIDRQWRDRAVRPARPP